MTGSRQRLTLAASLLVLLSGTSSAASSRVRVVTTTPVLASLVAEVGGDRVDVEAIARPDQDPHFVPPKPSLVLKLRRADLFVVVGLDLEAGWAPLLSQSARNARIQPGSAGYLDASENIAPLQVPVVATRAEGDVHPHGNPHYWLDPANAAPVARSIAAALTRVDPSGADRYAEGLADFDQRLREALPRWQQRLAPLAGREVISYHRTWPYLQRRFGIRFVAELEPKPGIPPSPRHVAELTALMREREIGVVVRAPYYRPKSAEELARRVGGRTLELPTEVGAQPDTATYFQLMDRITSLLAEALGGDG